MEGKGRVAQESSALAGEGDTGKKEKEVPLMHSSYRKKRVQRRSKKMFAQEGIRSGAVEARWVRSQSCGG